MNKIVRRILNALGEPHLLDKLASLPPSDLNSVLIELNKMQTSKYSPIDVLKNYEINRFSVPSQLKPVDYHKIEVELLTEAEKQDIESILLSPVSPLGSCSAFGCVDQNNVISALRGTEVISDPTNMLAIIIAHKIKHNGIYHMPIHLCTTARVTRTQAFSGKASFAHFGLFCIVSSGKDTGSYTCEKELLKKHLTYYRNIFNLNYDATLSITLRKRSGYTDNNGFFEKMTETMKSELPDVPIHIDEEHTDNNYYNGINFKIYVYQGDDKFEIGDGGFVDWIQRLTGNKKERCLISAISIDRLFLL